MSTDRNRQPAGTPTGGQFAEGAKPGSGGVSLAEALAKGRRNEARELMESRGIDLGDHKITHVQPENGYTAITTDEDLTYFLNADNPQAGYVRDDQLYEDLEERLYGDTIGTNIDDITTAYLGAGSSAPQALGSIAANRELYKAHALSPGSGIGLSFTSPTTLKAVPLEEYWGDGQVPPEIEFHLDEDGQVTSAQYDTLWSGTVTLDKDEATYALDQTVDAAMMSRAIPSFVGLIAHSSKAGQHRAQEVGND